MTTGVTLDMIHLLAFALEQGASDVHITTGEPPVLRVHGELRRLDMPPLEGSAVHALVYSLMNDRQRLAFEKHSELDLSFEVGKLGRFRVNVFVDRCGLAVAMRAVPSNIPSLAFLGLPQIVRHLCDRDAGLVLVTGPTACGKSTTLAAMVDVIQQHHDRAHHHHRGSDRVRSQLEARARLPARSRRAHSLVRQRATWCAA